MNIFEHRGAPGLTGTCRVCVQTYGAVNTKAAVVSIGTGGWRSEGSRYTNTHTHTHTHTHTPVISAELLLRECDLTHRPHGEEKLDPNTQFKPLNAEVKGQ